MQQVAMELENILDRDAELILKDYCRVRFQTLSLVNTPRFLVFLFKRKTYFAIKCVNILETFGLSYVKW